MTTSDREASIHLPFDKELQKYDNIKLGDISLNWSNYLYEGEMQELFGSDYLRINGRINRSNVRFISILLFGLSLCVLFVPALITSARNRRNFNEVIVREQIVRDISPTLYLIYYSLIFILFESFDIRRMRDTKEPLWKLVIPFLNVNLLYNRESTE